MRVEIETRFGVGFGIEVRSGFGTAVKVWVRNRDRGLGLGVWVRIRDRGWDSGPGASRDYDQCWVSGLGLG